MSEPIGHRIPVTPTGEHSAIDVAGQRAALAALSGPERGRRAETVLAVLDDPARFAPPVLYALATALFADGRHEEGAFWFYAAQVRTRFDVTRCADVTARGAAAILTEHHGPPINRWAFTDPERVRGLAERAVEWDRATPHAYDHRWVNLHGTGAFLADGSALSRPREEWEALAEQTRAEYLRGLAEVLAQWPGR